VQYFGNLETFKIIEDVFVLKEKNYFKTKLVYETKECTMTLIKKIIGFKIILNI